MTGRRILAPRAALALPALLMLAGCSQVAALAPVGGNALSEVRFAANDVLVAQGVDILEAPVCSTAGAAITCQGTTTDGQAIVVASSSADDATITVTVGSATLYSGSLQQLLRDAAEPAR